MNDRPAPGDPYPPAPAPDADYAPYDAQGVQYGNGSYTGHDGYDAYATGAVAPSTTMFAADGYAMDPSATGTFPSGGFNASGASVGFPTGSFTPGAFAGATGYESDPLFGDLPGNAPATASPYGNGQWLEGTSAETGTHTLPGHDPYGTQQHGTDGYGTTYVAPGHPADAGYDATGQWDATAWAGLSPSPLDQHDPWGTNSYPAPDATSFPAPDQAATGYEHSHEAAGCEAAEYGTAGYGTQGHALDDYAAADDHPAHGYPTGGYPADGYESQGFDPLGMDTQGQFAQHLEADPYAAQPFDTTGTQPFEHIGLETADPVGDHPDLQAFPPPPAPPTGSPESEAAGYGREPGDAAPPADFGEVPPGEDGVRYEDGTGYDETAAHDDGSAHPDPGPQGEAPRPDRRAAAPTRRRPARPSGSSGSRTRRRTPAKRSALLTVAVPSVCVMGVAGIAAASVGGGSDDDRKTTASTTDEQGVEPSAANNKLDTQLDNFSAGTRDFGDRASRTQERIDLEARKEAERKRAAEEAARKERLRPKFALPVAQHGLSAYYGQSGVNWMSLHTGIDFPVAYGTQVMAATDGTVRTQYNTAYGNMLILTAKDGTETWYCHLSSYQVSSGATVKAGDAIAFSGNSGNSTGPHLHFEVRPGGGSAIDPLPWLRSHGLDPE